MRELETLIVSAYERGRQKRALTLQLALACVALPLALLNPWWVLGATLFTSLLLAGAWFLWRGLEWERGYVTGLMAGLVPLLLAICARPLGHGCDIQGHCYSWCMPACACGAAIAAYIVTRVARSVTHLRNFGLSAAVATVSVGGLGCACLSASGAVALIIVYLATSVPALLWLGFARAR